MARKSAKSLRWARETRSSSLPDVLTVEQAARYLGIGRNSAYEAARNGAIPAVRIGRRLLVPKHALEQRLASSGQLRGDGAEDRG